MASNAISMLVTVDGTSAGRYLRGSKVTGSVAITVHEAIKYHSIEVVLVCQSAVNMRDRVSMLHRAGMGLAMEFAPEAETARLVHLFDKIILLKKCDSDAQEELSPGAYNFPFTFTVTKDALPSTFTIPGHAGTGVEYYVESLILPEKDATVAISRSFTYFPFIGTVDIGNTGLITPVRRQQEWSIGGCLCFSASKPISLLVELDRRGYCVGESMMVNVTVINGIGKDVKVFAELQRTIHCDVRNPHFRHRRQWDPEVIARHNSGAIGPHSTSNKWFDIVIPKSGPVTMSLSAEILKLYYELIVWVDSPYGYNLTMRIPIMVGCRNSQPNIFDG